jgi:signal transduction histidine kinase
VRKQLFVVRTSGARLLALINDVMDAATLRQHKLLLKQERLDLRQVVGDVVDLTRSLVCQTSGVYEGPGARRTCRVGCGHGLLQGLYVGLWGAVNRHVVVASMLDG